MHSGAEDSDAMAFRVASLRFPRRVGRQPAFRLGLKDGMGVLPVVAPRRENQVVKIKHLCQTTCASIGSLAHSAERIDI